MIPKGTLLIIGGAEDKVDSISLAMEKKNREFKHFEILHLLLKGKKKVEIITTASMYQGGSERKIPADIRKNRFYENRVHSHRK